MDLSQAYRERSGHAMFASEAHITFEREVREGDLLRFETQLLGLRSQAVDLIHFMYHAGEGTLAATNQIVCLHVELARRRAAPFPPVQKALLERIEEAHSRLPRPPQAGRGIKLR
jgi:acyl-CoA thioester hydrolase